MSAAIRKSGESGDTLAKATTRGPQADKAQFDRVMGFLKSAQADGLSMPVGGHAENKKGYYIEPTIIANAPENHRVVREEIFGPVVVINTFEDEDDVMKRANGKREKKKIRLR
jgi:aldehyde dehydrogenase (NAD+)